MAAISRLWEVDPGGVTAKLSELDIAIDRAIRVLGAKKVGRKFRNGSWESRFNRSIFEAEIFYFNRVTEDKLNAESIESFKEGFEMRCTENSDFLSAVEATTKTNESYEIRFRYMQDLINKSFGLSISDIPVVRL
jgi:hypothetical protein